jgi:hypothetical protein
MATSPASAVASVSDQRKADNFQEKYGQQQRRNEANSARLTTLGGDAGSPRVRRGEPRLNYFTLAIVP